MNITIGAFQTRDGLMAEVVDVRGQIAIGWVGLMAYQWLTDCGTCISGGGLQNNLIAVWVDAPKLRPWKVEEVPLGAWMRDTDTNTRWIIANTMSEARREGWLEFYEHSIDGGKTWKPCGVEVKP